MLKKILAMILSALLCSSVIAGCESDLPTDKSATEDAEATPTPSPVAETEKPTATPKPKKTAENLLNSKNADEIKALNIFLSNFSEADLDNYNSDAAPDNHALISFAFTHNRINNYTNIKYENQNMGISAENVNATLDKYFGASVPLKTAENTAHPQYGWTYSNGFFWHPAADGESYNFFSIAKELIKNSDGTYTVPFETFWVDLDPDESMNDWYSCTIDKANSNCEYKYSGTAVIKDKTYNGKNTYELVKYTINY